jgi:class 3 adenylate cyclase/tetratricopeptide (TPR) repeat protein
MKHFFGLIIFLSIVWGLQAQNDIAGMLQNLAKVNTPQEKLDYATRIARKYVENNNYEKAIEYYFQSLDIAEKINEEKSLANLNEELGILYQSWSGYEKSIQYLKDGLEIYTKQNNLQKRILLNERIGWAYFQLKKYHEALEQYEKVLEIQKILKNSELAQADTYNLLSVVSEMNGEIQQAITFCQQSLALHQKSNQYELLVQDYNNLAVLYQKINDRKKSLEYFKLAIETNKNLLSFLPNLTQESTIYNNLGVIHTNMRQYSEALFYYNKAQQIREKQKDKERLAETMNYIAANFYLEGELEKAFIKVNRAIDVGKDANSLTQLSNSYRILSDIHKAEGNLKDYENANNQYNKYQEAIKAKNHQKNQEILSRKASIEQLEGRIKLANSENEVKELEIKKRELELENIKKEQALAKERTEKAQKDAELARSNAEKAQKDAQLARAEEERAKAETQRSKAEEERAKAESENAKAQAYTEKVKRQDAEQKRQLSEAKAKQALNEQQRLKTEQEKREQFYLFGGIGMILLLILGFILFFFYKNREKNKKLKEQNDKLAELNEELQQSQEEIRSTLEMVEVEKQKSDGLLLNILPIAVAEQLKDTGNATPQFYEKVTVLFTDFRGFTNIAAKMTPVEVIKELNYCFLAFDEIIDKYNLEKIKTIGDAYMCAGGIPIANETNPIDAIKAGLEIQQFMRKWREEKIAKGQECWEIRLGIHTGEVIAGVVGKKKFAYDIWGDAVNTASRMESSGEVGLVNISGSTYELVKDYFECQYRGKVYAKNKGDIDMYFVLGEKK